MFATTRNLRCSLCWVCLCLWLTAVLAQEQNSTADTDTSWTPLKPPQKRQASSGAAAAKSYDPPPEFYRGPGSVQKLDSTAAGFISKPIGALPPVGGAGAGAGAGGAAPGAGESLSEAYDKWRKGGGSRPLQDRISVGHYGSSGGGSAGKSFGYEGHPYAYDYGPGHGYEQGVAPGHGYDQGAGPQHGYDQGPLPGHGYGSSVETGAGPPYHVYRPRPEPGHYAGPGVEYTYSSYPLDSHEIVAHKGAPEISPKALLAKSFLIPLASATVLGIAAAFINNPLLLQLAPVPGLGVGVGVGVGPPVVGKRRRRRRAARRGGNGMGFAPK
ncbi:fibroin heavy chain [Drosophila subobscura]|uniref:fibroin heavy chain n=1 Tax=Drosophila subobscura TaxID=7241 RepID=UPI00155A836D|nr:fibroin heavy chain [Drosophila subobscura]